MEKAIRLRQQSRHSSSAEDFNWHEVSDKNKCSEYSNSEKLSLVTVAEVRDASFSGPRSWNIRGPSRFGFCLVVGSCGEVGPVWLESEARRLYRCLSWRADSCNLDLVGQPDCPSRFCHLPSPSMSFYCVSSPLWHHITRPAHSPTQPGPFLGGDPTFV